MPLGLSRYSQHDKVPTEALDDKESNYIDVNKLSSKNYVCMYIGKQDIPIFLSNDVASIIDKVYSDNYSSIAKLIHLRKFSLHIDKIGIQVVQDATKKVAASFILQYKLSDILYITAHQKNSKVLAIVLKSSASKAIVHVYLCENNEDATLFIEDCVDEFQGLKEIKEIKKHSFPDSIELKINHDSLGVKENLNASYLQETSAQSNLQPCRNANPESISIQCNDKGNVLNSLETNFGSSSNVRNDSLDDEFSQLALKRNKSQPYHLQDKSIESTTLIQDDEFEGEVELIQAQNLDLAIEKERVDNAL